MNKAVTRLIWAGLIIVIAACQTEDSIDDDASRDGAETDTDRNTDGNQETESGDTESESRSDSAVENESDSNSSTDSASDTAQGPDSDTDSSTEEYLSEMLNRFKAVWVSDSGNVYIGGDRSRLVTMTDGAWQTVQLGTNNTIYDLWGVDNNHLFAAAGSTLVGDGRPEWPDGETTGRIFELSDGEWQVVKTDVLDEIYYNFVSIPDWGYRAIWGADANRIVAASDSKMLLFDGQDWQEWKSESGVDMVAAIHGTGEDRFYMGTLAYAQLDVDTKAEMCVFNDNEVRCEAFPSACPLIMASGIYGIWSGASNNDTAWFVGSTGICGWTNGVFEDVSYSSQETLWDVWGSGAGDVYAVGDEGLIVHYNGSDWSQMSSPVTETLYAVHGNAPDNIYAVGDNETVVHFNGESWQRIDVR
ncbi:MAG: hypothetical protein JXR76_26240 [Deltaproteobacteria bacterium]|nr:hypothetical protein [Deltaproteobacteria bacterium]